MGKIQLLSMTQDELLSFVTNELGESKFRAKQISKWLARGADVAAEGGQGHGFAGGKAGVV